MAKIVLFVDALEPREYGAGWTDTERGMVNSGYPKVTPKVTSEVYTGKPPSQNGMGVVHSMSEMHTHRPAVPTIQEKLEQAGYAVGSFHMPYCLPLSLQSQLWISEAMGQRAAGQHQLVNGMMGIPTAGDLSGDDDEVDMGLNTRREDIYSRSSNMLKLLNLVDLDVIFLGIRSPDEFTHFSQGGSHRKELLEALANEIGRWEVNHDILWWSDHGSEDKTDTFRVNKWLMEKGYLNLDIDVEFHEKLQDMQQGRQGRNIENQIGIQAPSVTIKESSQAASFDPYDSSIDVLDDELDIDQLITELKGTGYYDGVGKTKDIWGTGTFLEQSPDILTHRADGVLVTGNVHPEPIGMGFYRTGVHSAQGAWGTTDDSFNPEGDVHPTELHDIIWQFVTGKKTPEKETLEQINQMAEQMKNAIGSDN